MTRALVVGTVLTIALLGAVSRSWAQEEIANEAPPPASVEQSVSPMERFVERPFWLLPERASFFPWLKEQMKDTPPFFRDTKLDVNLRT